LLSLRQIQAALTPQQSDHGKRVLTAPVPSL
jgi:hypothetical protein